MQSEGVRRQVRRKWRSRSAHPCACVACSGFRVLEAGAGTGGLTKDALPLFDQDLHHEMLRYCATDVTNAFSGGLIDAIKSPKLIFKVRAQGGPRACQNRPGSGAFSEVSTCSVLGAPHLP